MTRQLQTFYYLLQLLLVVGATLAPAADADDAFAKIPAAAEIDIDFVKHIEPMLRKSCLSCHGSEEEEGGLRVDLKQRLMAGGDSGKVILPGESAKSRLIHLVAGVDEDAGLMPPEGEGTPLTAEQIGLLRAWIDQGAKWPAEAFADAQVKGANHWAFQPLERPEPPTVENTSAVRNPIDAFVIQRLEQEGIRPSPGADKNTLIRRLYLDLHGLPPSPQEVADFVKDESDDAYERLVDRLLASRHYGERWGRHWLDLARYADSDGYEKDRPRPNAWRYREWVIHALNDDMPFDEFTVKQIAGDMLPGATSDDRVATGFHRNTLHNTEGGVDREEDRVKKTVDRTNTIGSIWMGMTVGCAQCHSHKYDPLTQREYFSLYGFFNSIDESDIDAPLSTSGDLQRAQTEHAKEAMALRAKIADYVKTGLPAAQAKWEQSFDPTNGQWFPLSGGTFHSKHGATAEVLDDGSLLVGGANQGSDVYTVEAPLNIDQLAAIRLEVLPHAKLPKNGPGRAENGNFVLANVSVSLVADGKQDVPIKLSKATADFSQNDWPVEALLEKKLGKGWAVSPQMGKPHTATLIFDRVVDVPQGARLRVVLDQDYERNAHNLGRFRLWAAQDPAAIQHDDKTTSELAALLTIPARQRSTAQQQRITALYQQIDPQLVELQSKLQSHLAKAPKQPAGGKARAVVQLSAPRKTQIHIRGDFLNPGESVSIGTPTVLPELTSRGDQPDRLDFARWLVDKRNPLTARVTVNRIWARYFGQGIVKTVDDFGLQGESPTHLRLLDWLASELIDSGWRLKQVHKRMVMSSTYRQSSASREDLVSVDPENELLARQTRRRVEAEVVRDLALAASGLLDRKIGGPSVRPPQPGEYSQLTYANSARWEVSKGTDRYRRGLYTFFQRTSPYPMLMTFDSPDSNQCTAQRSSSNTPLQALTVWNDPAFFECAQALGRRIVTEASQDEAASHGEVVSRIRMAFMICLSRLPNQQELAAVEELFAAQLALTQTAPSAVDDIVGKQPPPQGVDKHELAAWIMVGRTLLNLDEFITKE